MLVKINNLKLDIGYNDDDLKDAVVKKLKVTSGDIDDISIIKRSLDARKKPDLYYVLNVLVYLKKDKYDLKKIKDVLPGNDKTPDFIVSKSDKRFDKRPVICGAGPAGLFAALYLAKAGCAPILIERGREADKRKADVDRFFETGILDVCSNVQFGEGGAGTFSDGKLQTGNKDKDGMQRFVLKTLVDHGADPSILYEAKPHIGTDVLIKILKSIRAELISLGADIRFETKLTDIIIKENADGTYVLDGIKVNDDEIIDTDTLILAIGHSARDTFTLLNDKNVKMERKDFAVGFRIEHPQEMINASQYGAGYKEKYGDVLKSASYKLVSDEINARRVYSFCMCPGGYVVNSSSEEGHLCVNGMSYSKRDGKNANSAIVVGVNSNDPFIKDHGVLSGMMFQREIEKKTFDLYKGKVPVQRLGDYKVSKETTSFTGFAPCILGAYEAANLRGIYPKLIEDTFLKAMEGFDKKISGFACDDAILSASETRTSSPVRILRDTVTNESVNVHGLYPCGEGAGYAGGIMSAACDGLRTAKKISEI